MITDKEHDSIVWLYKDISKRLSISETRASEIVHLCFEEFKVNVDGYNEALSIKADDLQEELESAKEKIEEVLKIFVRM